MLQILNFILKLLPRLLKTIDPTGSGDSFVAGIVYSWYNDLTFEEGLKLATSLGAANAARIDVCNISLNESNALVPGIDVAVIGKKMKTLDVTPR